ncbi:universal stress protein [Hymenobacter psychrotolerans]|uniref:Nucleotide-binding universal stress protein, UspA family n=1 Tax=Hymenobacter psychrotolerans DSM 18569 TaxID=1121959 RepID=A0A1M6VZE3_9BACT|nr:universal stress protein [Hymenobacter psychrotolerans]SHK86860.1 Nucleotide-binding universal stress protein, UspA family [Hymenobacter psychrotolerans DSM 18569]
MPAHFLVLTDFTPDADRALEYAAALAAPMQASIVLLHIRRESLLDPDTFTGKIRHMSEDEVAAALAERAATVQVPITVESTGEGIAAGVKSAIARHRSALIILGKPETEEIPDELVASTSLQLLRATQVPLLVVPVGTEAPSPPARITLAADGQPFRLSEPVVVSVQKLLQRLHPELTVTYVAEPEDSDDATLARASVLHSGLGTDLPHINTCGIRHRTPSRGILQAATETQADLVVVVARRRSFLGLLFNRSVSTQVILHSELPVLLLPASE